MKNNGKFLWLLLVLPLIFIGWYLMAKTEEKPARLLPYFGPKNADTAAVHVVPGFTFTDQNGEPFTEKNLEGRIYLTEFFFTTCQSICPIMNRNIKTVYDAFKHEPSLHFLSHTVDPETDSVPVLKSYAETHGVYDNRWHFVTGEKVSLYQMARQAYLLDNSAPAHPDEDFVHTQKFALVDKERRIRGYYDGTDSLEIVRLVTEIKLLLDEYRYAEKDPA